MITAKEALEIMDEAINMLIKSTVPTVLKHILDVLDDRIRHRAMDCFSDLTFSSYEFDGCYDPLTDNVAVDNMIIAEVEKAILYKLDANGFTASFDSAGTLFIRWN